MKTQKINIAIMLLFVAFALQACKNGQTETEDKAPDIPLVLTEQAYLDTFQKQLELPASLFPRREANLGASLPGKIEKFHFAEGQFVQKGDILVDLSAEAYTQALIELNALQKDFERVSRLRDKGSISEMEYDHLKAKLDAAQVKTDMLRKHTQVVAPFSGMIVDYLMEEGENYFFNLVMEPGYSNTSGILRLMQLNPLIAEIQVNEKDLNALRVGQTVAISVDALPREIYTGRISYIKPMLSTMTHSASVEVEVPNPGLKLKPGMYASCTVKIGEASGIFIPIDAIIRQPGTSEDFVYRVENDTAKKVLIRRIQTMGERALVDSISAGDTLVTKGKNNLIHGTPVEIKQNSI
ncbi:MAG: efflux RND transporter periplasmic adaptor subunit [Bacteroidales bacterium]|jgi:membrane fusion protein (multidrug efflux system)|nr:efflux RND transporter periplasmic adaptor subunit [Bacteroidales bacterium]